MQTLNRINLGWTHFYVERRQSSTEKINYASHLIIRTDYDKQKSGVNLPAVTMPSVLSKQH